MSLSLRVMLLVGAIISCIYVYRKIRKAQLKIEDAIFWISFFAILVMMSAFPGIVVAMARLMGILSPSNLVYLIIMFILLIKSFMMSLKISTLESRLVKMAQEVALYNYEQAQKLEGDNIE